MGSQAEGAERFRYRFVVVGRYRARTQGNDPHVTMNVLAGVDDTLVYCGTLTMSEGEWAELSARLRESLGAGFEVEERPASAPTPLRSA
ncbi:MAG TPA: hypothetical protein VJ927_06880 [Actinomycetota bacterium]|nr:hypothetical protein [Actinomycetota bacterium]